jgi:hypothetical protein
MKKLEFKFQPQEIRIGTEEILADLNYPVGAVSRRASRKAARRPRRPR